MTTEEYWRAVDECRLALAPLVERVREYLERLPNIRRLYSLRYRASHRAMRSNSNGATEQHQVFRASAWRLHERLASKASAVTAEFDALRRDVEALLPQLRVILPAHEIDSLAGKFHPAAIESGCEEVLRLESRVDEFWQSRPHNDVQGAQSRPRRHGPKPDMNKHRIIAGIVSPYGERWKEPANSQAIAGALDQMKVVKPKKWRESWTDCLECLDGRFNKAIEYSLKMVRLENSR